MKQVLALTEENIPELSRKTGRTPEELATELMDAINKDQVRLFFFEEVYVSREAIWDVIQSFLDREIEIPMPERKHIYHSWKSNWQGPFTISDLPRLDQLHEGVGIGRLWMASVRRQQIVDRGF